jgi:hypothetical protein
MVSTSRSQPYPNTLTSSRPSGRRRLKSGARAIVLFVHGSSSRHCPRNQFVAPTLTQAGLATLLLAGVGCPRTARGGSSSRVRCLHAGGSARETVSAQKGQERFVRERLAGLHAQHRGKIVSDKIIGPEAGTREFFFAAQIIAEETLVKDRLPQADPGHPNPFAQLLPRRLDVID